MKTHRRRRHEARTDYNSRFALLKSGKPRVVIRRTNQYIIVQFVESSLAQDRVLKTFSSKDLLARGWPKDKIGSLKSLAAAYLVGYLAAKSSNGKMKDIVVDIGMHRSIHGSRLYAALKGIIDGGIKVPHSNECLPSIERLNSNKNTVGLIEKIKEKI